MDQSRIVDAVGDFVRQMEAQRRSPKTIVTRRGPVLDFARFAAVLGRTRLQDVAPADFEAYRAVLAQRRLRPNSIDVYLRSVRRFFRFLEDDGRLFENPARDLKLSRAGCLPPAVLSVGEVRKLLAVPDTARPLGIRDRALLEVLYATGVRREECLQLRVADADLDVQTLRVRGKGGKERVVPLGQHAAHWVGRHLAEVRPRLGARDTEEARLWLGAKGKALQGPGLAQIVSDCRRRSGISRPVSPHALRRACATHITQGGAHPVAVAELLGHGNLKSLSYYLRLPLSDLRKTHAATNPGA